MMTTTTEIGTAAVAEARAAVYALLAHGFQYPDNEWYELLCNPAQWCVWPQLLEQAYARSSSRIGELQQAMVEEVAARSFDRSGPGLCRFQAAFDTLFGHSVSGKCSAYETEYGDSEINQRSAQLADLAGFYQAFGLEPASRDGDRPDFISVECEFMSVLCAKEAHARQTGNDEWMQVCADAQRAFLRDHLARWLPAFACRAEQAAIDPFYTALSRLAYAVIACECAQFGLPLGPCWLELRSADPEGETTISCLDATDCGPGSVACAPACHGDQLTPLNVDIGGA